MSDIAQVWKLLRGLNARLVDVEAELESSSKAFARLKQQQLKQSQLEQQGALDPPRTEAEAAYRRIIDQVRRTGDVPDWAKRGSESNYLTAAGHMGDLPDDEFQDE